MPFLGAADVLGHLPIYGILLTILLCGNGGGFAATLRRETDPCPLAHGPLPLPQVARALDPLPERGAGD